MPLLEDLTPASLRLMQLTGGSAPVVHMPMLHFSGHPSLAAVPDTSGNHGSVVLHPRKVSMLRKYFHVPSGGCNGAGKVIQMKANFCLARCSGFHLPNLLQPTQRATACIRSASASPSRSPTELKIRCDSTVTAAPRDAQQEAQKRAEQSCRAQQKRGLA